MMVTVIMAPIQLATPTWKMRPLRVIDSSLSMIRINTCEQPTTAIDHTRAGRNNQSYSGYWLTTARPSHGR